MAVMQLEQNLEHALALHQAGQPLEAAQLLREILLIDPNHAVANFHLGEIALAQAQLESSLNYFKAALE